MIGDCSTWLTHAEMLESLRELVRGSSQKQVAQECGVSQQFLNDVLKGRRELGRIAEHLGYRRVHFYEPIAKSEEPE